MNLKKEELNNHLTLTQIFLNMAEIRKPQSGNAIATIAPKCKGANTTETVPKKKKTTTKQVIKLTEAQKHKKHLKSLGLVDSSDDNDNLDSSGNSSGNVSNNDFSLSDNNVSTFGGKIDKDESINNDLVLANIEKDQHSRILKVIPRNIDNHLFFFEKPQNVTEFIYLPPSFLLDDHTVNAEIRSTQWENASVIMPLEFFILTTEIDDRRFFHT